MYFSAPSCRCQRRQSFRRAASERHRRLPGGQVDHPHIAPEHTLRQSRAERLLTGFFRREAFGVGRGTISPPVRFALFNLGKNARRKPVRVTLKGSLYPANVNKIATYTDNHVVVSPLFLPLVHDCPRTTPFNKARQNAHPPSEVSFPSPPRQAP